MKIPYLWANHLLLSGSAALIGLSIVILIGSVAFRRLRWARYRWGALAVFAVGLLLGGSSYLLLVYFQLPAYSRAVLAAAETQREASSFVKRGDPAPGFSIKSLEGTEVALNRLRGKTVLLVFFATWCGPCNQEMPHIEEIWQANRSRADFALLAIGREESAEKLAAFKAEHGYTFQIASDPKRETYSRYAKELIPRTYLIGPDGTVTYALNGFDEERMPELLAQVASRG